MGGHQLDRGEDWLHGGDAERAVLQAERNQGLLSPPLEN